MPKEYRTVEEVTGPLMLVREVENVKYDELGEIDLQTAKQDVVRCLKSTAPTHLYSCLSLQRVSTFQTVRLDFWAE